MTDRERVRRLSVENRLHDLRGRYGLTDEDLAMPDWLDNIDAARRRLRELGAAGDPFATRHLKPPPAASIPLGVPRAATPSAAPRVSVGDLDV